MLQTNEQTFCVTKSVYTSVVDWSTNSELSTKQNALIDKESPELTVPLTQREYSHHVTVDQVAIASLACASATMAKSNSSILAFVIAIITAFSASLFRVASGS
jgi:hypothetical protein